MLGEFFSRLADWGPLDTWIVVTAALAAMACAVPGNFLLLRRQSMMGDALSHTVLLGIVIAFLAAHWLQAAGWVSAGTTAATRGAAMFAGAIVTGVVSALLTEMIHKLGRVESSAALGVVFTSMFALGLLLIRVAADSVHIDPDCVLYGTIETVVMDTWGTSGIPVAAISNGLALVVNLVLLALFYKELRISTFDPYLATTLGINAQLMHYAVMAVTAATLVAAFESVGSILVIAMLIVPAATASLLTRRLGPMIGLSLVVAATSAVLGHALAIGLPAVIFSRLGFPTVVDASTAGMVAVAGGLLFVGAVFCAPRYGIVSRFRQRWKLGVRVAAEDLLGRLYRFEESRPAGAIAGAADLLLEQLAVSRLQRRLAVARLSRTGKIVTGPSGYQLTEAGRHEARQLVRSHRLWESYMARHFEVPEDHLHEAAERVEHFIDRDVQRQLAAELEGTERDPHGREIPEEEQDD